MSQDNQSICDYSDSDDFVQPSPSATRRSTRIQCRTSSWASCSSELILNALEDAGIPASEGISREDLLLLAQNTLGNPPASTSPHPDAAATTAQPKKASRKRSAKSTPRSAKRTSLPDQEISPTQIADPPDTNLLLLSAVQNLSQTVKGLQSKMTDFENSFFNPDCSPDPATTRPSFSGNISASLPSTSTSLPAPLLRIQPSFQNVSAPPASPSFNLSSSTPAQAFGRCFVPPAAATVSPHLRSKIIQGKDINLASLLLPSPAADWKMVECGDVAVLLKTSDPRLQRNLSF